MPDQGARPHRRAALIGIGASLVSSPALAAGPLAAIEKRTGGRLGVAALDVASGARIGRRVDERFPMCSTFKAMAAAAVLEAVEDGAERLDRFVRYGAADLLGYAPVTRAHLAEGGMTLGELCAAAVELSDNTAANLILSAIGGPAGWTAFVRRLGDDASRLDRTEPALNEALPRDLRDTTTPAAMLADLQAALLDGALASASAQRLRDWMLACKTGEARLRRGLGAGWRVADKTGSGDNGTANDIAVAWGPRGPVVIACYLTGARVDDDARDAAIADVGRAVAAAFTAPAASRAKPAPG